MSENDLTLNMPGDMCIVCKNSRVKDPNVSFHRFPVEPALRGKWLRVFKLEESQVKSYSKVCCRHFPGGDTKLDPQATLGKRFASPNKKGTPRAKRARARESTQQLSALLRSPFPRPSSSRSTTPISTSQRASKSATPSSSEVVPLTAAIGKQLDSNYQVFELPSESSDGASDNQPANLQVASCAGSQSTEIVVNTALLRDRIQHRREKPQGRDEFCSPVVLKE